jgi:hypothetical protein
VLRRKRRRARYASCPPSTQTLRTSIRLLSTGIRSSINYLAMDYRRMLRAASLVPDIRLRQNLREVITEHQQINSQINKIKKENKL